MGVLALLSAPNALGEGALVLGLLAVFGVGLLLGCAGVTRRSWGLLLTGLLVTAMPLGFGAMVLTGDLLPLP